MRRWAGIAVAAAALLAPAQASAQVPALEGVNRISGDRSGYLDVRIPDPVRMSFDSRPLRNSTFSIKSEGFAGVMLRRLGVSDGLATVVAAARFEPAMLCGDCEAPVESLIVGMTGIEAQASADYSWRIPAGDYRLYLLTDGRPADVRITLPGRGSRVLHPEFGVENPVPEVVPLLSATAAGPFQGFGRSDLLGSRGVQLWGGVVYVTSNGNVEIHGCSHAGGEPVTTVFAPGCPGGVSEGSYGYTYVLTEGTSVYGAGFLAEREAGDWSVGGSVVAAGSVGGVGWAGVVLPFQGDGSRIAPPADRPGDPATTPGPPPPPTPQEVGREESGRIRLLTRSARVRRGRVTVRIGCRGNPGCAGSIRLSQGRASRFSVPAGRNASIRLAVPRALARKVQRRGRAVAQVITGDERRRLTLRR